MINNTLLYKTAKGINTKKTPIWFMRQAGRYLPLYKQHKTKHHNLINMFYSIKDVVNITLLPFKYFDLDAAIIFSDILLIPDAMGASVRFKEKVGPVLKEEKIAKLINCNHAQTIKKLKNVYKSIQQTRKKLDTSKSLIGFVGAPWTLLCYMLGNNQKNIQNKLKSLNKHPKQDIDCLIGVLTSLVSKHLIQQIRSGADIVQIFDSFAPHTNHQQFVNYCLLPAYQIVSEVRKQCPNIPIIYFCNQLNHNDTKTIVEMVRPDVMSIGSNVDNQWAAQELPATIQGNLDPILMAKNKHQALSATQKILHLYKNRAHIFNLGHGVLPYTPIENVEAVINYIRTHDSKRKQ